LTPLSVLEETARILNVCPTTVRRYTNKRHADPFSDRRESASFRLSEVSASWTGPKPRSRGRPNVFRGTERFLGSKSKARNPALSCSGLCSSCALLYLSESYEPIVNGVAVSVGILRDELTKSGHEVFVFAPENQGLHRYLPSCGASAVTAHQPHCRTTPSRRRLPALCDRAFRELKRTSVHTQTRLSWHAGS